MLIKPSAAARFCLAAALAALPASAYAQLGAPRDEFFKPAQEQGADLPEDNVFPQGRQFPISFFSVGGDRYVVGGEHQPQTEEAIQAIMQRVKADHFTMIGPQYELNHRILEDARNLGLKAIYTVQARDAQGEPIHLRDLADADLDQAVESVRQQVLEVVGSDLNETVGWWYIQPEELRYWRKAEVEYLQRATDAIHEADPAGRPVWMYDPGHRGAAGLKPIAEIVDIVGKGMYTNYSSMFDQRVWARWTMEQEIEAIKQAGTDAIAIAVPGAFRHPGHYVPAYVEDEQAALPAIARWTRHDAYASLIAGAKGMVIFSLRERPRGEDPEKLGFEGDIFEAYYKGYAQVANELNGELGLGEIFLFGERRDGVTVDVVSGPQTITMTYRNNDPVEYPSIDFADIAHGRDRYVFLVNSTDEQVRAIVGGLPYGDDLVVHDLFAGHSFSLGEGEVQLDFRPYQVHALRIEAPK